MGKFFGAKQNIHKNERYETGTCECLIDALFGTQEFPDTYALSHQISSFVKNIATTQTVSFYHLIYYQLNSECVTYNLPRGTSKVLRVDSKEKRGKNTLFVPYATLYHWQKEICSSCNVVKGFCCLREFRPS